MSIGFDHDDNLRYALVGPAKYPNSPGYIVDCATHVDSWYSRLPMCNCTEPDTKCGL